MATTYGERLRTAREAAGLTQQQLASKVGWAVNTIHRHEGGKSEPKRDRITQLADALECDPQWLMLGDVHRDDDASDDPALMAFLETRMGQTATDEEVASLRTLRARTGRPTTQTYSAVLTALRTTVDPDPEIAARAKAMGAIKVRRAKR